AAPTSSSGHARARRRCPSGSSRSIGSRSCAPCRRPTAWGESARSRLLRNSPRLPPCGDALLRSPVPPPSARRPPPAAPRPSPARGAGGPLPRSDASVVLRSVSGARSVGVGDLLAGPGQPTAAPDELLEFVEVPLPREATGSCYLRLEYRRQMEIAVVGATAV